jgi:hypothetical protein
MNGYKPTYVKVVPAAGMATVFSPHAGRSGGRLRTLRTPEDNQRIAMRRAAFSLEATVRAHRCDTLGGLTFREEPLYADDTRRIWRNALRRSQPSSGDLFYAMVAERGATKRLHLHVLGRRELIERLAAEWETHGIVKVETVPFDELARVSEYMSKGFADPSRLFSRRYTALRGSKPTVERFEVSSHEEGLELIAELSSCTVSVSDEKMLLPFGRLTKTLWTPC